MLLSGSQDYVKAVRSFKLKEAFPNMESHPYDWRVDPYEPQRVWFTIRSTAKHTGPLNFAGTTYKATNKVSACDTRSQAAMYAEPQSGADEVHTFRRISPARLKA